MIHEDRVFVANVVVRNSTWEMMVMSVISQPTCAMWNFRAIAKIHKYIRFNERRHFIPMAMEVHNASRHDMDCFIALIFPNR
jgi:hypothetical protein